MVATDMRLLGSRQERPDMTAYALGNCRTKSGVSLVIVYLVANATMADLILRCSIEGLGV